MLVVLSPSKTLDYETKVTAPAYTQPRMLAQSQALVKALRRYKAPQLAELMGISDKLAALNAQRYQAFCTPFTPGNARPALCAFKGDVYAGIEVERYGKEDFAFAQRHIRILSGLYGVLRPLDLMQPYRLEMGTRLPTARGKDLYAFWADDITQALNAEKPGLLVNLASEEYFKAVRPAALEATLLTVAFKEKQKGGGLKVIGLFAKRARGNMANFIVTQRITAAKQLKEFAMDGYRFSKELSDAGTYIFTR